MSKLSIVLITEQEYLLLAFFANTLNLVNNNWPGMVI